MKQYIPKSDLVAEIKKLIKENELYFDDVASDAVRFQKTGAYSILCDLLHFLDTLEVKEVDLEKEVIDWWDTHYSNKDYTFEKYNGHYIENSTVINIAKHFFELGLASKYPDIPGINEILVNNGIDEYSPTAKIFKEAYSKALYKLYENKKI